MIVRLVTANVGGVDPGFALPADAPPHSVYYTDGQAPAGWTKVHVPRSGNPRLASKLYKCQVYKFVEADFFLWADASFQFKSFAFLPGLLEQVGHSRAAFIPHPDRTTLADEYAYILNQMERGNPYLCRRYDFETLTEERAHFSKRYNLAKLPLWSGGLWLVQNTPQAWKFFDAWWGIVNKYSVFDQCAITPCLMDAGIDVAPFRVSLYKNQYFERVSHA